MPRHRKYIFINGVRTDSNNLQGWHFRAARWVDDNTDYKADTYHYTVPGSFAWLKRARLVDELVECIDKTGQGGLRDVVLVGHSFGTDLICRALAKSPETVAHSLHLIGGAAQDSFKTNGLNQSLKEGQIGSVTVYFNPGDPVLGGWRFWKYLGYGKLGLNGATDIDPAIKHRVECIECPGVGHSGYFDPGPSFNTTMQYITKG